MQIRQSTARPGARETRLRDAGALVLATVAGLAIAYVDSRPGWDATGITVGALTAAAFVSTLVAGRRPWLWAILVGVWTPAMEITGSGATASLAALVFAAVGAGVAWLVLRGAGSA